MKTKEILKLINTKIINFLISIAHYFQYKVGYMYVIPLTWVAFDKQKHFTAGVWIASGTYMISLAIWLSELLSSILMFVVVFVASYIKEKLDNKKENGLFDWYDILWGMYGCLFAWIVLINIYKYPV